MSQNPNAVYIQGVFNPGSAASPALAKNQNEGSSDGVALYWDDSGNLCLAYGAAKIGSIATGGTLTLPLKGTATNDNAATGVVGEYIESVISSAVNIPESTGQWGDLTSISLTAGDWEVVGVAQFTKNGATITQLNLGISTTTGNFTTGLVEGSNWVGSSAFPTAAVNQGLMIPAYRLSLASTTIVYLKNTAGFSVATPQYTCRLSARRVR